MSAQNNKQVAKLNDQSIEVEGFCAQVSSRVASLHNL